MLNIKNLPRSCNRPIPIRLFKSKFSSGIPVLSNHHQISQALNAARRQSSRMALSRPWADGPFKLIPTPRFTQGPDQPDDQYTSAASQMAVAHNVILRALNR